jgi:UDP:flavonoid glycosyltransferase YjiC (YdhE family)
MAIGANTLSAFEPIPKGWLIEPTLPQVGLLRGCDLIIHHGGNNSVQEALGMGVHQIILPFSTDQFANGADLERSKLATVVSPNDMCISSLSKLIKTILDSPKPQKMMQVSSRLLANALPGR